MKNTDHALCLFKSRCHEGTNDRSQALPPEGIADISKQNDSVTSGPNNNHWSGQPGQDLFFNNWKLSF